MAERKNWVCPVCGTNATLGGADCDMQKINLTTATGQAAGEGFYMTANLTRCPNSDCCKSTLQVWAYHGAPTKTAYGGYSVAPAYHTCPQASATSSFCRLQLPHFLHMSRSLLRKTTRRHISFAPSAPRPQLH